MHEVIHPTLFKIALSWRQPPCGGLLCSSILPSITQCSETMITDSNNTENAYIMLCGKIGYQIEFRVHVE